MNNNKSNIGAGLVSAGKENRGITLIALIITIIVMLILVGVSVQILINSNLLGIAEEAGEKTKTAYNEESNMGEIEIGGVKYDSIEDYINNIPSSGIKINLSMVNTPVAVTADGSIVKSITEGAPIPVDFYYVGGTKNTGIVISDDPSDENAGVDADLVGNQFVWVPVLQNQTIKIEVTTESNITGIKIEDPVLEKITTDKNGNALAPSGTSYITEINPTINGTYIVTVTAGEETIEKALSVSSLYAQDFWIDYNKITADTAKKYTDSTMATYSNSVNTYGGFYIARYEAGTDTARTSSSDTTATVYSKKNMYPYNHISQTNAITLAQGMDNEKTSVTSDLINAAAWDRTLNWLTETKVISIDEMISDSTSWGNYYNAKFDFTGYYSTNSGTSFTEATSSTPKPVDKPYLLGTGVSEYTKRNNIYDLAGNCEEWTTEAYSSGVVVGRGGVYGSYGDNIPASFRDYTGAGYSINYRSFRPALYINQ